jgi:hypothetical protein
MRAKFVVSSLCAFARQFGLRIPERWRWDELRHRFILTGEEKRVITFVIAAFFLGVATKCYRDVHPQTSPSIQKKQSQSHQHQP